MTPNLNTQTFELEATTNTGVKVPLKLSIEYPDGFGMYAFKALSQIAESHEVQSAFISALASDGDASLLDTMAKAGMTLEEDEDGWE